MPNGKRVREYLPYGVLNVQSLELALSSLICQNASFVSIIVKTVFPWKRAVMSSTVGMTKCSRLIARFKSRGSKPFFFSTVSSQLVCRASQSYLQPLNCPTFVF